MNGPGYSKGIWLCPQGHDDSKHEGDNMVKKNSVSIVKAELQGDKSKGTLLGGCNGPGER